MGEWSLLPGAQADYERWIEDLRKAGRFDQVKHFLPGGTWRNFRVRYPEANLMYGRMLTVSKKYAEAPAQARKRAEAELYKGQCNCGYWHGVFGGLYLPFLRSSIYYHLLAAENELDRDGGVGYKLEDLDLDGREDFRLHNKALNLFLLPEHGARLAELDVRERNLNLTAGLSRRPEVYHAKAKEAVPDPGEAKSIHDVVLTKVQGIDRHLQYDPYTHASLLDHFFDPEATLDDVAAGRREIGDFLDAPYRGSAIRKGSRVVAEFQRDGAVRAFGRRAVPVRVRKEVSLQEDAREFTAEYTLRNLGEEPLTAVFGVEFFVAMMSPDPPAAFLHKGDFQPAGALGKPHDLPNQRSLWIYDDWHDLNLGIVTSSDAGFWLAPIRTVSMSEGGFELVYQGTAVIPRGLLRLEPGKDWHAVITHKTALIDKGNA
jgi:alpha-amylase